MITVYYKNLDDTIILNDFYFSEVTYDKVLVSKELQEIIERVEGVKFFEDKIISKFTKQPVNLSKLSTGCKTLINIITCPDKIFTIDECGRNVINEIYKLDEITVQTNIMLLPSEDFDNVVRIVTDTDTVELNSLEELRKWYDESED